MVPSSTMAKPDSKRPIRLIEEAKNYLKQHPEELLRAVRGAFGLRLGVPMDLVRSLARSFGGNGKRAPKQITVDAAPPGLRIGLTMDVMGAPLRALFTVFVEELRVTIDEICIGLRVEALSLTAPEGSLSPVTGFLQSGALDLSKPGNLVAFLPQKPAVLVDAKDDRITLDLMKIPQIAQNLRVRRALTVLVPFMGVGAIKTKDDHLDIHFKANLTGVPAAIAALRAAV